MVTAIPRKSQIGRKLIFTTKRYTLLYNLFNLYLVSYKRGYKYAFNNLKLIKISNVHIKYAIVVCSLTSSGTPYTKINSCKKKQRTNKLAILYDSRQNKSL